MPKGIFRFYEELNDFLPEYRKKTDFEAEFNKKSSIKNIIEKLGVPPTEVDLVLITENRSILITFFKMVIVSVSTLFSSSSTFEM
ncbi:MAG: hypothetical protein KJ687_06890 [Proteobacteria bacterium]|nr:hypothetical protein [Pseudomonadota bacterium]